MALRLLPRAAAASAPPAGPNPHRARLLADLERIDAYPTLSETAVQVSAVLASGDPSIADVASIVRRDGTLAAAVLRVANSWVHRGGRPVDDVRQAVLRLGLQECGRVLCAFGARAAFAHRDPRVQERCDALFRHAMLVAQLSGIAAKFLGDVPPGAAFTAGLLHDIGRLVVTVRCPDHAGRADPLTYAEGRDAVARERDYFGTDHCAVGYHLAVRNGLPEGVARVALHHHRPEAEAAHRDLVALVAVMDDVANHVQRERRVAGYRLARSPFYPAFGLRRSRAECERFERAIPLAAVQAVRTVRTLLKTLQ